MTADALAGGSGARKLGLMAPQGSAGLQQQFGGDEAEGLGCPDGGVDISGSERQEGISQETEFVVRRYLGNSQYRVARKAGILFDPLRGSGIPTTSAARAAVAPDHIREMTGAMSADYYIDYNVRGLDYFERRTGGGWPEYVIQGDLTPERIVAHGRVPKSVFSR